MLRLVPALAGLATVPFLLIGVTPLAAAPSAAERVMQQSVDGDYDRSVALLEQLVNINSGTHNPAGVKAVADVLRPEFEALGFTVEWIDGAPFQRAGHLFARHEGKAGSTRMLLIAHLDTVFEPSSPFQRYNREAGSDIASGPGVVDDKGGIVVILSALKAMQAAGTLKDANIVVALTGDEEDAGSPLVAARASLMDAARWADVALDFEGLAQEGGRDMGSVARRGSNSWTVRASGRTGHSSGIFGAAGDGSVYELARILSRFRAELTEPNATFNVGLIAGGAELEVAADGLSASVAGKGNIIPPVSIAKGDLRTLSEDQTDRVIAGMQAIAADHLPGTQAELTVERRYPAMPPTERNRALLAQLNAVNRDLGLEEQAEYDPAKRGAGDINFIAAEVDGLAGMGPGGAGSHAEGETIDLPTIRRQALRAAALMSRLSGETSVKSAR